MTFNIKDHLPKGVADALFEEEKTTAPAKPSPLPVGATMPHAPAPDLPNYTQTPPIVANPLLDDLRRRTSFEATPLGQQLQGYIGALDDTGLSEDQKIKTALKLGHFTAQSVIETLNGVQQLLVADKQKFEAQMTAASATEVSGRQQKIAGLDSQIAEMESQLNAARQMKSSLTAEAMEKSAKIASLRSDYASAYDARNSEILQMITRYQQNSTQGKS